MRNRFETIRRRKEAGDLCNVPGMNFLVVVPREDRSERKMEKWMQLVRAFHNAVEWYFVKRQGQF